MAKKKKSKQIPLIISAAVLACVAIVAVVVGGESGNTKNTNLGTVIGEGECLEIHTAEVGETASFYPIEVDGTIMEVLAIRDSEGKIRTAFNTCESCYGSGKGYYVASGNMLVCQNCGFRFTADQVEVEENGGCNPYPIFEDSKVVTDDLIRIPYEF